MFETHIHYNLGDMIPPNQGSNLSQDSALNRGPRENFYISRYEIPNEIQKDVLDREKNVLSFVKVSYPEQNVLDREQNVLDWKQNLLSFVKFSQLKGEIVTHGRPYKFAMLIGPEISHLGKNFISPNW